jgi:hypothetical protein
MREFAKLGELEKIKKNGFIKRGASEALSL